MPAGGYRHMGHNGLVQYKTLKNRRDDINKVLTRVTTFNFNELNTSLICLEG